VPKTSRITRGLAAPAAATDETDKGGPRTLHNFKQVALHYPLLSASGRLLERAVFGGCLLVPPTALTVVGVVNFPTGTIELTGPHSQRAVADWLDLPQLAPAELRESGSDIAGHELSDTAWTSALEPELHHSLLKRGGVERDGGDWRAPDGRRTTAVGDALVWALERIARGADGGQRRRRQ
jgi:hypothetical protein